MNNKKIGAFLCELRKEKGLTQEELAQIIFVDRGTVSKWERGIYSIGTDYLIKLSEYFEVSISEIIYGERKSNKNKDKIKNVVVDIIDDNKRKLRKRTIIGVIVVFVIIFIGLLYYFFNTYNSINVYKITGSSERFNLTEGLMMYTHETIYIKLGDIESYNDEEIKEFRLYFIREEDEITLYDGSDDDIIYINDFADDNPIIYDDIKYIKESLMIEVTYDDNEIDIFSLDLTKYFSNNYLISKTQKRNLEKNEVVEYVTPDYIIDNFELDTDEEKYQLIEEYDDKIIRQEYFYDVGWYVVYEVYDDYEVTYNYSLTTNCISYSKNIDGESEEYFDYYLMDEECLSGICDEELINYFIENYLDKVELNE